MSLDSMNSTATALLLSLLFCACSPSLTVVMPEIHDDPVDVPFIAVPPVIDITLPLNHQIGVFHPSAMLADSSVMVWILADAVRVRVVPDTVGVLLPVDKTKRQKIVEAAMHLLSTLLQK